MIADEWSPAPRNLDELIEGIILNIEQIKIDREISIEQFILIVIVGSFVAFVMVLGTSENLLLILNMCEISQKGNRTFATEIPFIKICYTIVNGFIAANQVSIKASQVAEGAIMLAQGATEQASCVEELSVTLADVTQ